MSSHASSRAAAQTLQGRTARAVAHTALVGLVAGGATMATMQIAQAVPTAPNNITIFPQRDFVSFSGYQGHIGETATITVSRGGVTTGTAQGSVAAGDPALEVNHPGGVCWQGVTPNIKPGDVVSISFAGTSDSATTLAPEVTSFAKDGVADLVVQGTRPRTLPTAQFEQRIVAPALRDTAVGRRDVRAPSRPSAAYTSTLTFPTATTFTARYHFNDQAGTLVNEGTQMRNIAAAGQARALSWQVTDAAGNPQGLTISEFGEVGGPGFGGCPAGPETMAPNAPTNVTTSAGDGWVGASWSPATTMPDAPAITGYRVSAVDASGVQTSVNALCTTTACSATVPNLINGRAYTVEVRALSTAGASAAALAPTSVSPTGVVQPPVGATAPNAPTVLSASSGSPTGAINATVNWTAPAQPAGVTIDGWRVTAYDMSTATPSVIKRVFVDETAGTSSARSRTVAFATAGPVSFKVQAIAADEAGTLSALSVASTTVQAQ